MKRGPLIGILVANRSKRKAILGRYQRNHDLNLRLCAFTPRDIRWKSRRIVGLVLEDGHWKIKKLPFPKAIYNRCYNKKAKSIQRLKNRIGKKKCFNSINFFNKWDIFKIIDQSFLKSFVPDTFLYRKENVLQQLEQYKLLYIKPVYGNRGKNVHRIELMENGDFHISLHSLAPTYVCRSPEDFQVTIDKLLGNDHFIVQQGIRSSLLDQQLFDIRVLVQKNRQGRWSVSTIASRLTYEHYFNTSIYSDIYDFEQLIPRIGPISELILHSLHQKSINVAQVVEAKIGLLGEVSADYILDENGKLWIIELNGSPQKSIYDDMENFQDEKVIYQRPIEYAYFLSRLRKKSQ